MKIHGLYKIYKLNITLEDFNILAIQYEQLNKKFGNNLLSMSFRDLKMILELLEYQTEFVDYLAKRIICNQYIQQYFYMDEKYLWVEYKVKNLESIFNKRYPMLHILDTKRAKIYEEYYVNNNRTKALNKNMHPKIKEMIYKLEKAELLFWSKKQKICHKRYFIFISLQKNINKYKQIVL